MERRTFLKRTLIGGAALAAAGAVPLWLRSSSSGARRAFAQPLRVFSADEATTLAAVAARLVAPLDAEKLEVVQRIDSLLADADDVTQHDLKQLLALFDNRLAGLLLDGRLTPFTALAPAAQDAALLDWRDSRLAMRRSGFQALQRLCLAVSYADPSLYAGIGYPGPPRLVRADGSLVGGEN